MPRGPKEPARGWECDDCGAWSTDLESSWCRKCRRVRKGTDPDTKDGGFSIEVGNIGPFFDLQHALWNYGKRWSKSEDETERRLGKLLLEALEEYLRRIS